MDSFFIRSEIPADIPAIFEVNLQAFGQDGEARLVRALRNDRDYIHELSLVAVHDNKVIGHILFVPVSIESEDDQTPAVALAPLSVAFEYQCRGVGSSLIEEGLRALPGSRAPDCDRGRAPVLLPPVRVHHCPGTGDQSTVLLRQQSVHGMPPGSRGTRRRPWHRPVSPAFDAEGAHAS